MSDSDTAIRYGESVLRSLGIDQTLKASEASEANEPPSHPASLQANSGLLQLTGRGDRNPLLCPVPMANYADGLLKAFNHLVGHNVLGDVPGSQLLTERAAYSGSVRNGRVSVGGSSQLLNTLDGVVAVSLTRESDWELLPAWLQCDELADWQQLQETLLTHQTEMLVSRGRLLGLAVADAHGDDNSAKPWYSSQTFSAPVKVQARKAQIRAPQAPRVIDLSSLWAGPLCSHLLQRAGAEVIKVESSARPDGARNGSRSFYDLLNHGKPSVALPLATETGRQQLRQLIKSADIVIEGSRPRALQQMGIDAEKILASTPGLSWISITGYGRQSPQSNWIAYGDDAGVAAGLSAVLHDVSGEWAFCGDAIADPITGLHAAVAAWSNWQTGGGKLIDISLYNCVRNCIEMSQQNLESSTGRYREWQEYLKQHGPEVREPQRRPVPGPASEPGAENIAVLGGHCIV